MTEARRIQSTKDADAIAKNPYWNPNKIILDGAQREALLARVRELDAAATAAWSTWTGATGMVSDRADREGKYTKVIATPPSFGSNMIRADREADPDADPDEASSNLGTGGVAFQIAYFSYFSPAEYPALGALKRAYNRKLLELHDGVRTFFEEAGKGR
jgi:hypothetical protein